MTLRENRLRHSSHPHSLSLTWKFLWTNSVHPVRTSNQMSEWKNESGRERGKGERERIGPPDTKKKERRRRSKTSESIWWQNPFNISSLESIGMQTFYYSTSFPLSSIVSSLSFSFFFSIFLLFLPISLWIEKERTDLRYFGQSSSSRDWMDLLLLSRLSLFCL